MPKFKVGDKVKWIGSSTPCTVKEITKQGGLDQYWIEDRDGNVSGVFEDSIRAANSTSPVVANALAWKAQNSTVSNNTADEVVSFFSKMHTPDGYADIVARKDGNDVIVSGAQQINWRNIENIYFKGKFRSIEKISDSEGGKVRIRLNSAPVARNDTPNFKIGDIVTHKEFGNDIKFKVKDVYDDFGSPNQVLVVEVYKGGFKDSAVRFRKA